jgi:hypothetical protein
MACRDLEDAIAVGISIFRMLVDREQAWRDQVFRGTTPFADEEDCEHRQRFADWLDTSEKAIAEVLPELQQRFGTVEGTAQLRRYMDAARSLLRAWQPPRLSAAVGLREMTLSPEAAAELDRILAEAGRQPPESPRAPMQELPAAELHRRSHS